jgi:hypothetical protein
MVATRAATSGTSKIFQTAPLAFRRLAKAHEMTQHAPSDCFITIVAAAIRQQSRCRWWVRAAPRAATSLRCPLLQPDDHGRSEGGEAR